MGREQPIFSQLPMDPLVLDGSSDLFRQVGPLKIEVLGALDILLYTYVYIILYLYVKIHVWQIFCVASSLLKYFSVA